MGQIKRKSAAGLCDVLVGFVLSKGSILEFGAEAIGGSGLRDCGVLERSVNAL